MNKLVLMLALAALCTLGAIAQQTSGYVITHVATYDIVKFTVALNRCSFDNYRKYDERVTLTFEDGSTVELLSVTEMQREGLACDTKIVTPANHKQENIFVLHPDGYVLETVRKDKNSNDRKMEMVNDLKKGKP